MAAMLGFRARCDLCALNGEDCAAVLACSDCGDDMCLQCDADTHGVGAPFDNRKHKHSRLPFFISNVNDPDPDPDPDPYPDPMPQPAFGALLTHPAHNRMFKERTKGWSGPAYKFFARGSYNSSCVDSDAGMTSCQTSASDLHAAALWKTDMDMDMDSSIEQRLMMFESMSMNADDDRSAYDSCHMSACSSSSLASSTQSDPALSGCEATVPLHLVKALLATLTQGQHTPTRTASDYRRLRRPDDEVSATSTILAATTHAPSTLPLAERCCTPATVESGPSDATVAKQDLQPVTTLPLPPLPPKLIASNTGSRSGVIQNSVYQIPDQTGHHDTREGGIVNPTYAGGGLPVRISTDGIENSAYEQTAQGSAAGALRRTPSEYGEVITFEKPPVYSLPSTHVVDDACYATVKVDDVCYASTKDDDVSYASARADDVGYMYASENDDVSTNYTASSSNVWRDDDRVALDTMESSSTLAPRDAADTAAHPAMDGVLTMATVLPVALPLPLPVHTPPPAACTDKEQGPTSTLLPTAAVPACAEEYAPGPKAKDSAQMHTVQDDAKPTTHHTESTPAAPKAMCFDGAALCRQIQKHTFKRTTAAPVAGDTVAQCLQIQQHAPGTEHTPAPVSTRLARLERLDQSRQVFFSALSARDVLLKELADAFLRRKETCPSEIMLRRLAE